MDEMGRDGPRWAEIGPDDHSSCLVLALPAAPLPPTPHSAPAPLRVDPGIAHGLANDDPS